VQRAIATEWKQSEERSWNSNWDFWWEILHNEKSLAGRRICMDRHVLEIDKWQILGRFLFVVKIIVSFKDNNEAKESNHFVNGKRQEREDGRVLHTDSNKTNSFWHSRSMNFLSLRKSRGIFWWVGLSDNDLNKAAPAYPLSLNEVNFFVDRLPSRLRKVNSPKENISKRYTDISIGMIAHT
jgi:hypothetical protein